ncbi:MAG: WYL domain-containing protein [Acidimicrobiia bacterium]|nr:WYL domain-containing protein [Acidimicrobiia bacterium]
MQRVIERLLNLLAFLLSTGRPVTADEIRYTVAGYGQEGDDAFRRTFERDKDLLRRLGVPLRLAPTDAWEVEQGYVLQGEEYALPDPGLSDEERAALWLAAQVVRAGGQAPDQGVLFKLGGLPPMFGGAVLGADLGEAPGELERLFEAVTEAREVAFAYRGKPRRVRPYGLVHRRGHWYLVGPQRGESEPRAFRVDRLSELRVGSRPGAFTRPRGWRAGDAVPDTPWQAGEAATEVTVRFDPEIAWWARRQLGREAVLTEEPGGGLVARLRVASVEAFVSWMVGFEDRAEVLQPPELRQALLNHVGLP